MLNLTYRLPKITLLLTVMTIAVMIGFAQQRGKASYYSRKTNGSMTSSGVRLHNDSLVCAHRTYPFGTLLNVKNPANGKEVVVKVIDRGPHGKGRIIDLSYEAARRLDILSKGVAMVEVSLYEKSAIPFKPKDYSLPELDLEIDEEEVGGLTPQWQHSKHPANTDASSKSLKKDSTNHKKDERVQRRRVGANT